MRRRRGGGYYTECAWVSALEVVGVPNASHRSQEDEEKKLLYVILTTCWPSRWC